MLDLLRRETDEGQPAIRLPRLAQEQMVETRLAQVGFRRAFPKLELDQAPPGVGYAQQQIEHARNLDVVGPTRLPKAGLHWCLARKQLLRRFRGSFVDCDVREAVQPSEK